MTNERTARPWGKVAVSVRCGRGADPMFLQCWTRLLLGGLRPADIVLEPVIESLPHYAAETIARRFLATSADCLLFIDDDMIFEPNALNQLRDSPIGQYLDVVQGLCVQRGPPHWPLVNVSAAEAKYFAAGDIITVQSVGLAFTLIRRTVFEVLKSAQTGVNDMWFAFGQNWMSEDIGFSKAATEAGFLLGVHAGVQIGHRFPIVAYWDTKENAVRFDSHGLKKGNET